MSLFKKFLLPAAALLLAFTASAQYYVTGSAKGSIKWRKMEGRYYRLVYPEETDSLARRYMWLLESNRERIAYGVRDEMGREADFKLNVILHPYTTRSNGMVAWVPKRMELYTRPMADALYPESWERQLALHESRHVMQIAPFTRRFFKPLNYLFGEQITGLGLGIFMRRWYLEGDAVVAETELSKSGRGRSASFMEYYRTAALTGHTRSFERWYFGSPRYYTPNQYPFGYMMLSYGRISSGDYNLSGNIINGIIREFYNPAVVNRKFGEHTGLSRRKLFYKAFDYYSDYWKKEWESRGSFTSATPLAKENKRGYYTEYRSPLVIGEDSLICIKSGKNEAAFLVLISEGKERVLHPFSASTGRLERNGKEILWTETIQDTRWEIGSVERLMAYNLESGKIRALLKGDSYYNPAAEGEGDTLAVVEYPVKGGSLIRFLYGESYEKGSFAEAPDGGQITEVAYCAGKWYAFVITGRGVGLFSYCNGRWERIIAEQHSSLTRLRGFGEKLFFVSDIDGVNNIYMYDIAAGELGRVTNSEFGATDPFPYNGKLYYISLNLSGRYPVCSPLVKEDNGLSVTLKGGVIKSEYRYGPAEVLAKEAESALKPLEERLKGEEDPTPGSYKSRRYRKGTHLFNFHSWMPFYLNVNKLMNLDFDHTYEVVSLGATLYSQNLLGTALSMLGYSYRNGRHAAHASFEYSGWYPVFRVNVDYNEESKYIWSLEREKERYVIRGAKSGKPLLDLMATLYLPLKFNGRGWNRGLTPQLHYQYKNDEFYSISKGKYINRQQFIYGLKYYQLRDLAEGAPYPKWGFGLSAMGLSTLSGNGEFASVAAVEGYLYLPSPLTCHGIRIGAGYQKQGVRGKLFYSDNLIKMPRGYTDDIYSENFSLITADYAIPFNLKGLNLGWPAYIKQIKLTPFADFGIVYSKERGYDYFNSAGFDLLFNTNFFRLGTAVDIGLRYARRFASGGNYFGLLFDMELF